MKDLESSVAALDISNISLEKLQVCNLGEFADAADGELSTASQVRFICSVICLLYRYQHLAILDIKFLYEHEGSSGVHTVSVDHETTFESCKKKILDSLESCDKKYTPEQYPGISTVDFTVCFQSTERFQRDQFSNSALCTLIFENETPFFIHTETDRYSAIYNHLYRICEVESSQKEIPFSQVSLLSKAESDFLINGCGNDFSELSKVKNIHSFVEKACRLSPDADALLSDDGSVSYDELNRSANQLARVILDKVGNVPSIIAVDLARKPYLITTLLAILKSGHAYLPIERDAPPERVQYMLQDCACPLVITDTVTQDNPAFEKLPWDECVELMHKKYSENIDLEIDGESLAYINYTSGSTGMPKGVAVYHKGVVRLNYNSNFIKYDTDTRMLQLSNVGFDAATFEIWGPLMNAVPLVIYNGARPTVKGLRHHVETLGANTAFITTSLFNYLVEDALHIFGHFKYVIFGGDKDSVKHVTLLREQYPELTLVHAYGPTECTTFTTTYSLNENDQHGSFTPIGKPVNETHVHLLDDQGNISPIGAVGELYVGGSGLASGYINKPEKTAEAFLIRREPHFKDMTLYRTGDLAYKMKSGDIVFVARRDSQIKLRGFRVELGEITNVLSSHEKVSQAYTIVTGDSYDTKKIISYVSPEKGVFLEESSLKKYLIKKLPKYMVPSEVVQVSRFPLNANGKIDKSIIDQYRIA